jgi:hypothetical protein
VTMGESTSMPVAPRCEPPEEFRKGPCGYYWLRGLAGSLVEGAMTPAFWSTGKWLKVGGTYETPEEVHADGWRYYSPAFPPSQSQGGCHGFGDRASRWWGRLFANNLVGHHLRARRSLPALTDSEVRRLWQDARQGNPDGPISAMISMFARNVRRP